MDMYHVVCFSSDGNTHDEPSSFVGFQPPIFIDLP